MELLALVRDWDRFMAAEGLADETRRNYRGCVTRFLADTLPSSLVEVTEETVANYLGRFRPKAAARGQYVQALRSFFSWAVRRKHCPADPTAFIKVRRPGKPPAIALTLEELQRVIVAAAWRSERRAWSLMLTYSLGTRRIEVTSIRPQDVGAAGVWLARTKGDRPRLVELHPLAVEAIEGLRPWWNGTILGGIVPQTLTEWAMDAARDAGLEHKVANRPAHILRASFASHLLRGGAPVHVVSQLLGHQSLAVTTRYAAVFEEDRQASLDMLSMFWLKE
jgi:integrase/recombinase XerD